MQASPKLVHTTNTQNKRLKGANTTHTTQHTKGLNMPHTVENIVQNEILTIVCYDIICTLLENDNVVYNDYYENLTIECSECSGTGEGEPEEDEIYCDYCDGNGYIEHEPLEYWVVTKWMARKLKAQGGFVFEISNLTIWGRETSGQAIRLDCIIQQIADETT